MVNALISIGLALIPFTVVIGTDTRLPKMAISVFIAFALCLSAYYRGIKIKVTNKWLLIFLAYLPLNFWFAFKPLIDTPVGLISNFWIWKSLVFAYVFSLMYIVIESTEFSRKWVDTFMKIMMWVGTVMASYCILQSFHLEQFFMRGPGVCESSEHIGGSMGNPTLVSPFIAFLVPFAVYFRKYISVVLMIIAVYLTHSKVAIGSMVLGLLFYWGIKNKKNMIIVMSLCVICLCSVVVLMTNPKTRYMIGDSGRLETWTQVFNDIKEPIFVRKDSNVNIGSPLTGFGLGSFEYLFKIKHPDTIMAQVHNEYIEIMYNAGIVGVSLFLLMIYGFIRQVFVFGCGRERPMLAALFCISLSALGTFVWQLGGHLFYTVVIAGVLASYRRNKYISVHV